MKQLGIETGDFECDIKIDADVPNELVLIHIDDIDCYETIKDTLDKIDHIVAVELLEIDQENYEGTVVVQLDIF